MADTKLLWVRPCHQCVYFLCERESISQVIPLLQTKNLTTVFIAEGLRAAINAYENDGALEPNHSSLKLVNKLFSLQNVIMCAVYLIE